MHLMVRDNIIDYFENIIEWQQKKQANDPEADSVLYKEANRKLPVIIFTLFYVVYEWMAIITFLVVDGELGADSADI